MCVSFIGQREDGRCVEIEKANPAHTVPGCEGGDRRSSGTEGSADQGQRIYRGQGWKGKVQEKISHFRKQFNLNLINFQLLQASGDGVTNVGKKLINGAKVESHESHEDHHHHAGESSSCELVVL